MEYYLNDLITYYLKDCVSVQANYNHKEDDITGEEIIQFIRQENLLGIYQRTPTFVYEHKELYPLMYQVKERYMYILRVLGTPSERYHYI